MGDSDDSYDFPQVDGFLSSLRVGMDLVTANRFKGAMLALHRYPGNPALSIICRVRYCTPVGDFQCRLRGFNRAPIRSLGLRILGTEPASEMVLKASLAGPKIAAVPTVLVVRWPLAPAAFAQLGRWLAFADRAL